jgi:serine/threonine protein kinase
MIPRRIGRYEINRLLGQGGVGRVYAAHDTLLSRQVAIKVLRPEASRNHELVDRFLNEAKSFGDLRHPNITMLYDLDLHARPPHMVMELVEGHTLEELLEGGPVTEQTCLAVIAQASAGLVAAHHKGVIHRDIKPSNLMVTGNGTLKIMDFGIARMRGTQRLTRTNQVLSTLLYASPEQLRAAEVDERTDIYSLGAVSYELLAGMPPFTGETDAELRAAQLEKPPPRLSSLVPGVATRTEAAILRALAKSPRDRFSTVEEFVNAVGAAAVLREATDILQLQFPTMWRQLGSGLQLSQQSPRPHAVSPVPKLPNHQWPRFSGKQFRSNDVADELPTLVPRTSLRGPLFALCTALATTVAALGYIIWPGEGPRWGTLPPSRVPRQSALSLETTPSAADPVPGRAFFPPPNPNPVGPQLRQALPPTNVLPSPTVAVPQQPLPPWPPAATAPEPRSNAFLGTWTGVWNNSSRLHGQLIVKKVQGTIIEADYFFELNGRTLFKGLVGSLFEANSIVLTDDEGSTFEFLLAGDTLQARFSSKSGVIGGHFSRTGPSGGLSVVNPAGLLAILQTTEDFAVSRARFVAQNSPGPVNLGPC